MKAVERHLLSGGQRTRARCRASGVGRWSAAWIT